MSDGAKGGAAKKPSTPGRKTYELPIQRIGRVRCSGGHHWLSNLYVIWAPVPDPALETPKESDSAAEPGEQGGGDAEGPAEDGMAGGERTRDLTLSLTDSQGYLSPPAEAGAEWVKTHRLADGVSYHAWFVRHPSPAWAGRVLEQLQRDETKYADKRHTVRATVVEVPAGMGKTVKEVVIEAPETPESYIHPGVSLYGGWFLFREMPNDRCEPVRAQVTRLQEHLGALRYIVGNDNDPYVPPAKQPSKDPNAPRAGVFNVYVWNALLAFQRDVVAKKAFRAADGTEAPPELVSPPGVEELAELARCDDDTAKAIEHWRNTGLRKPGRVLVQLKGTVYWLRDDVVPRYTYAVAQLKAWGWSHGLPVSHTFRRAEVDVGGAAFGRARLSIHKTGLALDLASKGFASVREAFPVIRMRVDAEQPRRRAKSADPNDEKLVHWLLFGQIRANAAPAAFCRAQVREWHYDRTHPDGGTEIPRTAPPGQAFLNLTEVLESQFGLRSIHSFRQHWFAILESVFPVGTAKDLYAILKRVYFHRKYLKEEPFHTGRGEMSTHRNAPPAASEVPLSLGVPAVAKDIERLEWWLKEMTQFGPTPTVAIDPATEPGRAAIARLRRTRPKHPDFMMSCASAGDTEVKLSPKWRIPSEPFTLTPKLEVLTMTDGVYFRFPEIPGEAIGLEWWHYQATNIIRSKSWGELMGEIGWTREGLLLDASGDAPDEKAGLGYMDEDLLGRSR